MPLGSETVVYEYSYRLTVYPQVSDPQENGFLQMHGLFPLGIVQCSSLAICQKKISVVNNFQDHKETFFVSTRLGYDYLTDLNICGAVHRRLGLVFESASYLFKYIVNGLGTVDIQ